MVEEDNEAITWVIRLDGRLENATKSVTPTRRPTGLLRVFTLRKVGTVPSKTGGWSQHADSL